jgi:hypothetical protein
METYLGPFYRPVTQSLPFSALAPSSPSPSVALTLYSAMMSTTTNISTSKQMVNMCNLTVIKVDMIALHV